MAKAENVKFQACYRKRIAPLLHLLPQGKWTPTGAKAVAAFRKRYAECSAKSEGLGYTPRYQSGPNKGKYRVPWYVSQRWAVQTPHIKTGEWVDIYTAKDKKKANADAAEWRAKTGQRTRVVPGAGHKTKRNA